MNQFNRYLQSCFEEIRDPLLIVDADGNVLRSNLAARSVLDIGERGKITDVAWLDRRVVLDGRSVLALVQAPSPIVGERLRDAHGNDADVVLDVLDLEGEERGSRLKLIHVRDYSPYTKVERWKDELISMAAHEIKNPLAAMRSSMNVLVSQAAEGMSEGQKNLVAVSIRNIDRLTRLLDNVLDVSRIGSGGCDFEPAWVDAHEFSSEVIGAFKSLFNVRRQRIECSVSNEIHRIYVDAAKLEQILVNLLNNAIKFTQEEGEVSVMVEPASLETLDDDLRILPWKGIADLRFIRFTVRDTGIGMTEETLSHLFTRYYQDGARRGSRGSHLGLSISRTLAEAQNGTLVFESELGVGTAAALTLPADETTFTLLARTRSIERVLARLLDFRENTVLGVLRKSESQSWESLAPLWSPDAIVNPTVKEERSNAPFVWTLGERVALSLASGRTPNQPVAGLSRATAARGGAVGVLPQGMAMTTHDLSPADLRLARVLGLAMKENRQGFGAVRSTRPSRRSRKTGVVK
ncbi:MAG: transrane receptor with multiple sensor domain and histidine kinase domain [Candidatus Krumholzibacteriota bacterium]|nr:transrane receptor with multiple sensor domain and histidine kinase domain [Candidatus Krumholzibacteriota bacterium]